MSDMSRLYLLRPRLATDSHESCKRDLADMRRQRDEATAREHLLRTACQELLDDMAEDRAQRHPVDKYRVFQISPEAVEQVRAALAAKEPSDE